MRHQAFQIEQSHVLVHVARENYRPVLHAKIALRFRAERETIYGRLTGAHTEHIDRVSMLIDALDDSHRAAIDCRSEEASQRRVATIFQGQCKRRELLGAITREPRIEIFKSHGLESTAAAHTDRALPQFVE